jgi:hypothetical protein
MNTLDDIRTKYPHLGVSLYALDPGKPVTLELLAPDGKLFSFTGATEAEAVAAAFPDEDETQESERADRTAAVPPRTEFATREDAGPPAPTPSVSVFD